MDPECPKGIRFLKSDLPDLDRPIFVLKKALLCILGIFSPCAHFWKQSHIIMLPFRFFFVVVAVIFYNTLQYYKFKCIWHSDAMRYSIVKYS